MAKTKPTKSIKKRVLDLIEDIVNDSAMGYHDVALIAGIGREHLYLIRTIPDRNFTIDQLHALGSHFGWDMNYIFYGKKVPLLVINKKGKISEQMREIIISLESVEAQLESIKPARNKKRNTTPANNSKAKK